MRLLILLFALPLLLCPAVLPGPAQAEEPPVDLRELVIRSRALADRGLTGGALPDGSQILPLAEGLAASSCAVVPTSLDFGTVELGSSADLAFVIRNTGDTILSGVVEESCDHYLIVSGGGAYSVAPGDSIQVTVRFQPTVTGTHTCMIETGDGTCYDVYCVGDTGIRPNTGGRWGLHYAGPHNPVGNTCAFELASCEDVVVDAPAGPGRYDVYVIAVDVDEIAGTRFGVTCDGATPFFYGWTKCGFLEIPTDDWPGCDEGTATTWAGGQPGPNVTVGILDVYIYGSSSLTSAPDPRTGFAEWCDASPEPICYETVNPEAFSTVGFGIPGNITCLGDSCLTPVLESPPHGTDCVPPTVTLVWGHVYGAVSYEVQIGTSCGTGTVYVTSSPGEIVTDLMPLTQYYWRVRAECPGGWGAWSPCLSFTTAPTVLPAPDLVSPADSSTCLSGDVLLDWADVSGAVVYEVQVGTVCGAGDVYTTTASDTTVTGLAHGTTYYWRTRVMAGVCDTWGSWSQCWSFTTTPATPGTPFMFSPADSECVPSEATFDWASMPGALTYELQIGTSCGAGSVYVTTESIGTVTGLTVGETYYWRVRAGRECDVWGEWSLCRSFIVAPPIPDAPVLVSPADSADCLPTSVMLDWEDVAGATGYEVQMGSAGDCASGAIMVTTNSSVTVGSLGRGVTFCWRVRASAPCEVYSDWSESRIYTTAPPPPAQPVLTSPGDAASCISVNVTLDWEDVPGAEAYELLFGTDCVHGTVYATTVSETTMTGLDPGTMYWWSARASAHCDIWGSYSPCRSFTTTPAAPGVPALTSPPNGAVDLATAVLLEWECVAGATGYDVQVGTSCGTGTTSSTSSCELEVSGLSTETEYFWRVRAKADCGVLGNWSGCFSFTTGVCQTAIPALISPPDGSTCRPTVVNLDWEDLPTAVAYQVQIGTGCGSGDIHTTIGSDTTVVGLAYDTTYYWRVKAKADCGDWGAWSECRSFTTLPPSPLPAPLLTSPLNGETVESGSATLRWDCVSGAVLYAVEIGGGCGGGSYYTTTECSKYMPGLNPETTYYWRVRARDNCGSWGDWSDCYYFMTPYLPNLRGKWALHYAGVHDSTLHTCDFALTDCGDVIVDAPSSPGRYDIYIIAVDVDAIAGTRYGLSCSGSFMFYGWTPCTAFEISTAGWPGCNEGNAQAWPSEQPGYHVTLGILDVYVYGPSSISTGPDPRTGFAEWCDGSMPVPICNQTQAPDAFSTVGFGVPGEIECWPPVPVALAGFDARSTEDGILLEWESTGVSDFSGFFVHRTSNAPDGEYTRLNVEPIEGVSVSGRDYSFLDADVIPGTLYYYKLEAIEDGGRSFFFGPYPVLAEDKRSENWLAQNVPNPFSSGGKTTITFSVASGGAVTIRVLDVAGRLVWTETRSAAPGDNQVVWDGTNQEGKRVTSGVYFYEIEAKGFSAERKMLVLD